MLPVVEVVPLFLVEWRRPASSWASWAAVCWDERERLLSASLGEEVSRVDTRSGGALIGDMCSLASIYKGSEDGSVSSSIDSSG